MSTVVLESLGCKLNQAEMEDLSRQFLKMGYEVVESPQGVDVYVLNTCTVTHIADRKARHRLRWVRRNNPDALIVALGCGVGEDSEEWLRLGVDLALGNGNKEQLLELLGSVEENASQENYSLHRTRSFIKIQEGCSSYCAFCIVPQVRGRERSVSEDEVVAGVAARVAQGYKEVVLTGTKIGTYQASGGLYYLIKRILTETAIERLRLSSLQPQEITPQLLELWHDQRLCNHLHIPLQSGDDTILRRMGRQYSTTEFEQAVQLVREMIPDVAISTDVMVGFPGEGEREFVQSYHFCKHMGFAGMHVFPYSLRPGTRAAEMRDQVNSRVKKQHAEQMLSLAKENAMQFRRGFLGCNTRVLWEQGTEEEIWNGLTPNYMRVWTSSRDDLSNTIRTVRLTSDYSADVAKKEGLWGNLLEEEIDG